MPTAIQINLKTLINQPLATQVYFTLVGLLTSEGASIVIGTTSSVTTNSLGLGTVNLSAGNYVVKVLDRQWTIGVAGTGTANLIDLINISIPTPVQRGVPVAGLTDQILAKNSDANFDTKWVNIGSAVTTAVLAGLSLVASTAITASDTVLTAFGKVQTQITNNLVAINLKINKSGDTVAGLFTNSVAKTQLFLTGDATGNDLQGNPVANSSPRIWLKTHQVSTYNTNDPEFGGYSELIRLQSLQPKAKPTIAWLDMANKSFAWIVGHYEPQDLKYYPSFAAFPVTGVNDFVTGYKALDTNNYYYWNGSAYIQITENDERYYYMARHQHISVETADNTGSSNYTRLDYPYGYNVVPINFSNAHLRVKTGITVHGTQFGATILEDAKIYAGDRVDIYPSANIPSSALYKNDNVNNVYSLNSESFRIEKLAVGNASNPTSNPAIGVGTSNAIPSLVLTRPTTGNSYVIGSQDKAQLARTSASVVQWGIPGASFIATSTSNLITNAIRYIPFFVPYPITLSAYQFEVTSTPASNANLRFAIYTTNNYFQPNNLVQDFGSIPVANGFTGIKNQSINQFLSVGWYLLAVNCDFQIGVRCFISPSPFITTNIGATPFAQRFDVNSSFGAFPNSGLAWATTNASSAGLQHIAAFQWF